MSEATVNITDTEEFIRNVDALDLMWDDLTVQSLTSVLNRSPRSKILRLVPKSNPKKYAKKDGSKSAANRRMERGNLQRSFKITSRPDGKEVTIGFPASSKVQYANAMHELPDPLPSGRPVDWSTPNTGNKFVQGPLEETADSTPAAMCREIDARLRRMGL